VVVDDKGVIRNPLKSILLKEVYLVETANPGKEGLSYI
jgi:CheY-like chemotaxis protein